MIINMLSWDRKTSTQESLKKLTLTAETKDEGEYLLYIFNHLKRAKYIS